MAEKPTEIPLMEHNETPKAAARKKKTVDKRSHLLIGLVFTLLVLLVVVLTVVLIITLFKRCGSTLPQKPKPPIFPKYVRKNNSYWNEMKLPDFAHTKKYIIELDLLQEAFNLTQHSSADYFFGRVAFNVSMTSDSKFLVLNAKNLTVINISVNHVYFHLPLGPLEVLQTIYEDELQIVIFVFKIPLMKDMLYHVIIDFSGNITTSKSGILRTFYRNVQTKKTYNIIYSKLEPIGARRIFPCFDEPDRKATYDLQLRHLAKYTALSNMPLWEQYDFSLNASYKVSHFKPTKIYMSTYLVAFVLVEDFKYIMKARKEHHNVSIWLPTDFQDTGKASLEWAVSTENFFEKYLNFSSPLPKSDHIYIPSFLTGAMENWGLMTYREQQLLMSPRKGNLVAKKALMTIAHEIAHIWFGNWVTTKTWDHIWLNEGFATYFASLAFYSLQKMNRSKADELYLLQHRAILEKDGKMAHPVIRVSANVMSGNLFNSFVYMKGEALLVWLNSIMGEQRFRAAVQQYVHTFAQGNPTTKDFFDVMEAQSLNITGFNESLYDLFKPYLDSVSYPVVTVSEDPEVGYVQLTQEALLKNLSKYERWPILTTYKSEGYPGDVNVFFKSKAVRLRPAFGFKDFVLLNSNGKGYFRVNYSSGLWTAIIEGIRSGSPAFSQVNKIVLFDDNIFFANKNLINISITKRLIDTLGNETVISSWIPFYNTIFVKIFDLFGGDKIFVKWSAYVKKLSKKLLDKALKISLDGNLDLSDEILQTVAFIMNCRVDNVRVLTLLNQRYEQWIANPGITTLPKHLASTILYYGVKSNDNQDQWMKMWNIMVKDSYPGLIDKDQVALGLTGTSKPFLLNKLLHYILVPHTHRSNVYKRSLTKAVVDSILLSNNGINVIRRWIVNNELRIVKYAFGDNVSWEEGHSQLEALMSKIASTTDDFSAILPLRNLYGNKETLYRIMEINSQWKENFGKRLLQHL